jgi:hypothetical protein
MAGRFVAVRTYLLICAAVGECVNLGRPVQVPLGVAAIKERRPLLLVGVLLMGEGPRNLGEEWLILLGRVAKLGA